MRRSKYPSLGILDALSRMLFGSAMDPSKNGLYESLPPQDRPPRVRYSKILSQLGRNGYIIKSMGRFSLTPKGKKKAAMYSLERVSLQKKRDGARRLIAFDIPESMRYARDIIRSKLKAFECDKIQKSLYMTPYVCEREVQKICRVLKIERYVTVFKIYRSNFSGFNDRVK